MNLWASRLPRLILAPVSAWHYQLIRIMYNSIATCFTTVLTVSTMLSAAAGNWPGWRGPEGTGVSSDKNLPLKWSDTENVRWRVALPGPGNSSPIVWGNRVFVTQAIDKENRRAVLCF